MLFFIALFIQPVLFYGQQTEVSPRQPANRSVTKNLLYNRVVIFQKESDAVIGFFMGVNNDSLHVLEKGNKKSVAMSNILRISMDLENRGSKNILPAVLWGIHMGNFAFNQGDEDHPFAFYTEKSGFLFSSLLGMAIFGGIASLSSNNEQTMEFDFSGDAAANSREWKRFKDFIIDEVSLAQKQIHFSLYSSYVFSRGTPDVGKFDYNFEQLKDDGVESFNLVRRIQLSFSLDQDFELGAAVLWLSEPQIAVHEQPFNTLIFKQSLESVGFFAVGYYQLFRDKLPQNMIWKTGAGIGRVDVTIKHNYYENNRSHKESKVMFGLLLCTKFDFIISNNSSLGLFADYVAMPSQKIRTISGSGFPGSTIKLGNASIGLKLGFHF